MDAKRVSLLLIMAIMGTKDGHLILPPSLLQHCTLTEFIKMEGWVAFDSSLRCHYNHKSSTLSHGQLLHLYFSTNIIKLDRPPRASKKLTTSPWPPIVASINGVRLLLSRCSKQSAPAISRIILTAGSEPDNIKWAMYTKSLGSYTQQN